MKKVLLLCFIVCATLLTAPGARGGAAAPLQNGTRADAFYRDGARLALEGRLAEAARAFEQAVALDPSNGNAHYGLGNVYAESGRWAEAVNSYHKAVSINREDVEAYNNLGVALAMRGQHVQAAAAFEKAVKIYPKWAEPHYHLGEARRALGQEDEAREAFGRALRLRPDYASRPPRPFANAAAKTVAAPPGSQVLKAMNALNLSDVPNKAAPTSTAEAEPSANTSAPKGAAPSTGTRATERSAPPVGANASNGSARPAAAAAAPAASPYDLGVREARAGRHAEAVAAFRQAIILDRRNAAAHRALGDAYAALGEWRESVDAYEQAARLAPDDAETYQKLGRSYARLRETTAGEVDAGGASAGGSGAPTQAAANSAAARPAAAADPDPTAVYRIGPGDVLDVRVPGAGEGRTNSYKVTSTGLLDYPALREPLAVAGLTTEEAAARLAATLRLRAGGAGGVVVGVREYASHAIIVGGMVKEAGTKILQREAVPLYVIIAHAQPLAGAGQAVVVSRATGRTVTADLSDTAALKMLVRPGDVITVRALPPQFVYVGGAVREPGQKVFHAGLTLTQAVLAAGGVQATGGAQPQGGGAVTLTRQGADGRLSTSRYSLADIRAGRTPDPLLRPGDRVEVLR